MTTYSYGAPIRGNTGRPQAYSGYRNQDPAQLRPAPPPVLTPYQIDPDRFRAIPAAIATAPGMDRYKAAKMLVSQQLDASQVPGAQRSMVVGPPQTGQRHLTLTRPHATPRGNYTVGLPAQHAGSVRYLPVGGRLLAIQC